MELGSIAVVISFVLVVYVSAAIYIVTRCMYRAILNVPSEPYHLHVVIDDSNSTRKNS